MFSQAPRGSTRPTQRGGATNEHIDLITIRSAIAIRGIRKQELAAAIGVHVSSLSRYLAGKQSLSPERREALIRRLVQPEASDAA